MSSEANVHFICNHGDNITNFQYLRLLDMNCFIICNALNRWSRQSWCVKIPPRASFNRTTPASIQWSLGVVAVWRSTGADGHEKHDASCVDRHARHSAIMVCGWRQFVAVVAVTTSNMVLRNDNDKWRLWEVRALFGGNIKNVFKLIF